MKIVQTNSVARGTCWECYCQRSSSRRRHCWFKVGINSVYAIKKGWLIFLFQAGPTEASAKRRDNNIQTARKTRSAASQSNLTYKHKYAAASE